MIDALDPHVKKDLLKWLIKTQLDPYVSMFDYGKESGTLELAEVDAFVRVAQCSVWCSRRCLRLVCVCYYRGDSLGCGALSTSSTKLC